MIPEDSSVIILIQESRAPERIPLIIMGMVTAKKAFILLLPREIAASSMDMGICCKIAMEERMV